MARRWTLRLSEEQQQTLSALRDQTKEEAVRKRCAALLKIAQGVSAHQVAKQGLLRRCDHDTVYKWLDIYEAEGIVGLQAHRHGDKQRRGL